MATIKTTSKKTALENPASSSEESISENSSAGSSNQAPSFIELLTELQSVMLTQL